MSVASDGGPVLAADGTPLKRSLERSLRMQKLRALMLVAPLLLFIVITFLAPIADMLFRSVENQIVSDTLPETIAALSREDPEVSLVPSNTTFSALYIDLFLAVEAKEHTKLGTRLNYEATGISSLFRKSGRRIKRLKTGGYREGFAASDPLWVDAQFWQDVRNNAALENLLPQTFRSYDRWEAFLLSEGEGPANSKVPEDYVFVALYNDLSEIDALDDSAPDAVRRAHGAIEGIAAIDFRTEFEKFDKDWMSEDVWKTFRIYSPRYTEGYFLNAVDLKKGFDGIVARPESEQIYITLFQRTMVMSLMITACCILLGYPIAWLMANRPMREANLLMIMVLLPFWTSLLVRTSAWKVMLQQQGVINDTLVWLNLVDDAGRLVLINNQFGTIVAMTHILLPFMVLPMYSVMRTIPEAYTRAAKSLGATNWTAFWRVYFPQSVPGIGAGSILVFILSIGYYITPEIVGGTSGTFISNRIAYHISSSLNWGLAAALGSILLLVVLLLYYVYDRIVGIDNVKLGG